MKLKYWIRIAAFVGIAALGFVFFSNLLQVANERDTVGIYGFDLEPEDSIDVVMIGASSVYTYFYAPLAYEKEGFTSYALATSTMTAPLYKYAARLAIEKQHPQLLVFETWSFSYEEQIDEPSLRKFLDAIPDSDVRREAIDEIVPEDLKESFRYPFLKYHSNLDRLDVAVKVAQDKKQMKKQGYSITKNFATTPFKVDYLKKKDRYNVSEEGLRYLDILLDYLKEAGVENALFVRMPEMIAYESTEQYSVMIDKIRNAGYDFVNLNAAAEDIGIDYANDFYNSSHLNIYGAEKFTNFFADYLMKRYQLDTAHTAEVTAEWDNCASYNDAIITKVKKLTDDNVNGFLYTQDDFLK